jgi:hypothetical protein
VVKDREIQLSKIVNNKQSKRSSGSDEKIYEDELCNNDVI